MATYSQKYGRQFDLPSAVASLGDTRPDLTIDEMIGARKYLRKHDSLDLAPILGLTVEDMAGAR